MGALLIRAIEAATDALFRAQTAPETEPAQRRADAIALVAERALAAGFGVTTRVEVPIENGIAPNALQQADATTGEVVDVRDAAVAASGALRVESDVVHDAEDDGNAAALRCACEAAATNPHCSDAPVSGTRAERYQVLVHVESRTLEWGSSGGRSELEDGTHLSAETSRRLTCDASIVRVTHDRNGTVLDVGRRTRTIPNALRRALEVRDRVCCFPGCGLRFTDGHHIIHWADRRRTSLENTCLVCAYHHRLLHEGGYRAEMQASGRPTFYDPRGLPVPEAPPVIRLNDSAADELVQRNRSRGVTPDFRTGMARYRKEDDIPWPLFVKTIEALDAAGS